MTQRLLTLILLIVAGSLTAQDIIWEDDFTNGMAGWTVNALQCGSNSLSYGDNSGPEYGTWELTNGTIDGEDISEDLEDVFFEWSFLNDTEYTVTFYDLDLVEYGYVYGTYSLDAMNVMTSSVDPDAIVAQGTAFVETTDNGTVEWATNMSIDDVADVIGFIGVNNPTVEITNAGNTIIYTSADGSIVFEYTKRADCGTIWTWSPNGNLGDGVFYTPGTTLLESDTRENGAMVMLNVFQMFRGDATLVPDPNLNPYPQYTAELISPPIDVISADRPLEFSFSQTIRLLNTPPDAPGGFRTSYAISNDDGATWTDPTDINPGLGFNTTLSNRKTFSILAGEVGGSSEIRIKFTFSTDYHFWGIDDVVVQERDFYDVQANSNFFAIPDNASTPWSQLQEYYFMSDIQNNSAFVVDDVMLNLQIVNETDGGTVVYDATKNYGTLGIDSVAENDFFDPTLNLPTDESSIGTYAGVYTISIDSVDSRPDNNTLPFEFEVTDTLFAKETGRTRGIFLNETARDWYIGNSYYVPNGENWYARYVTFMIENGSEAEAGAVTLFLYESDGDTDGSGLLEPEEHTVIGFNDYTFDGSEDMQLITVPVDVDEMGIQLQSGKYYFAVVQYVSENIDDQVGISGSEEYDYNANNFITDSIGIEQYSDVVAIGTETPTFFSAGFTGNVVPIVRLSIGDNPFLDQPAITAISTVLPESYGVAVFPVPAKDVVNLKIDFPTQTDVLVRLYDKTGRILLTQEYDQLQNGTFEYDVRSLPSGAYFLQLDTDAGTRIEKIVVQH